MRLPLVPAGLACIVVSVAGLACSNERADSGLEVYPEHTRLYTGERIRYSVLNREAGELAWVEDHTLVSKDPSVARILESGQVEALSQGSTELVIRSPVGERSLRVEVTPQRRGPIPALHYSEIDRLSGESVLFVGHANLDGFDHTAVAKAGIDRLVRAFKSRGQPVAYFVSLDYPYWYTEDRSPDLALVSEGQEHAMVVDAGTITFTGGDFMICTLRNVQMTLHGILREGVRNRIRLEFPADAIWAVDRFESTAEKEYPAPMTLLSDVLARRRSARERHAEILTPFLDGVFGDFPVLGYPSDVPEPSLNTLVAGWRVEASLDDGPTLPYRLGDQDNLIRFHFRSSSHREPPDGGLRPESGNRPEPAA